MSLAFKEDISSKLNHNTHKLILFLTANHRLAKQTLNSHLKNISKRCLLGWEYWCSRVASEPFWSRQKRWMKQQLALERHFIADLVRDTLRKLKSTAWSVKVWWKAFLLQLRSCLTLIRRLADSTPSTEAQQTTLFATHLLKKVPCGSHQPKHNPSVHNCTLEFATWPSLLFSERVLSLRPCLQFVCSWKGVLQSDSSNSWLSSDLQLRSGMATGDLEGNLNRLLQELRLVKFPLEVDVVG